MLSLVRRARSTPGMAYAVRSLTVSAPKLSEAHHEPVIIQGTGGKPGEVPTDFEQATGLERAELLGRLEGIDIFHNERVVKAVQGTLEAPTKVWSLDHDRIVGCTGFPEDSHEIAWLNVNDEKPVRCPECGGAYLIDFQGPEHSHH